MLGGLLALIAAATFGFNSVAIRRGVLTGSVAQGLAITVPIAIPIFFFVILFTGNIEAITGISTKSVLLLSFAGAIHFNIGRYANFRATKAMGANLVGPIISSSLILTLTLAIIFLDEVLTPLKTLGIMMIIFGPIIALRSPSASGSVETRSKNNSFTPNLAEGYSYALLSAIIFGITPILIREAFLDSGGTNVSNGLIGGLVAYISATAALALYLAVPKNFRHAVSTDRVAARWFIVTGIFVCVSHMLRFMALAVAPVSVVSPIIQSSGIFRTIFGWFINKQHEIFDAWVLTGIAMTILGAIALTLSTETILSILNLPTSVVSFLNWTWP